MTVLLWNSETDTIHDDPPKAECLIPKARREGEEDVSQMGPSEVEVRINGGARLCRHCFEQPED